MIAEMRFIHLVSEAGSLLARMRVLGATFEDLERASKLIKTSNEKTIGGIIHDLQSQIQDLEQENEEAGINPNRYKDFE